ncbi:MAG: hypothetical protein JKY23_04455 [Nitrospinaceae bacterium]|nr:hypothetical protein [Nitrospinaceae bacterium]
MRIIICGILTIVLISCASGTALTVPQGITVADEKMVSNCDFVSDVFGSSPFYGVFANSAINGARQAAMESAKEMGATHIIFDKVYASRDGTVANGKAYSCGSGAHSLKNISTNN